MAKTVPILMDEIGTLERQHGELSLMVDEIGSVLMLAKELSAGLPPVLKKAGDLAGIQRERMEYLNRLLKFTCVIGRYLDVVPALLRKTGIGPPWPELLETALPSPLASKRRGFPDLRATFLDRLGSDGALRAKTQIRTIQENARKRVGRWLETQIQGIGAVDDPALSARWTCLSEFAGLLQEGKPLPKAAVEEPREDVAP